MLAALALAEMADDANEPADGPREAAAAPSRRGAPADRRCGAGRGLDGRRAGPRAGVRVCWTATSPTRTGWSRADRPAEAAAATTRRRSSWRPTARTCWRGSWSRIWRPASGTRRATVARRATRGRTPRWRGPGSPPGAWRRGRRRSSGGDPLLRAGARRRHDPGRPEGHGSGASASRWGTAPRRAVTWPMSRPTPTCRRGRSTTMPSASSASRSPTWRSVPCGAR